jgi:hypothetical protein
MDILKRIEKLASERGLTVVDRGNGHLQIVGGPLLVNYYPLSKRRSVYIAGTTRRYEHILPEKAVSMCFDIPGTRREFNDARKGNYRKLRKRMLEKSDKCHWCGCILTIDTSTMDHVIPLYRGGLDNANNRVLACEPCNKKRGHSMPELKENEIGIRES